MGIVASNKRASFDYELKKELRAGIMLSGGEVKSVKAGNVSLAGSLVRVGSNAAWLANAYIAPYQNQMEDQARRSRKLLLNARELAELASAKQSGLHVVPLRLRTVRGLVKLDLATGRIRRKTDKRQTILARQAKRQASRRLSPR
jgi:SsrA-binding protein